MSAIASETMESMQDSKAHRNADIMNNLLCVFAVKSVESVEKHGLQSSEWPQRGIHCNVWLLESQFLVVAVDLVIEPHVLQNGPVGKDLGTFVN